MLTDTTHEFDNTNRMHPLIRLLAPATGESILDIGCGDGTWGKKILSQGAIVTGLDRDIAVLKLAEQKGLKTVHMDANQLHFDEAYDAVFTNAMLNWLKPVENMIPRIYNALKPGGRVIGEFGGHGNISSIRVALRHGFQAAGLNFDDYDPWDHPLTNDFCDMLQDVGFEIDLVDTFPRYTPLPLGLDAWLVENLSDVFSQLPTPDHVKVAKAETIAILDGITSLDKEHWIADFVRIRFKATKPEKQDN